MGIWENILNSFSTIYANKLRSGLTMLGIIIGVSSVIVMIGIGQGAQASIVESIQQLGSNTLIVQPGTSGGNVFQLLRGGGRGELQETDAEVIENIKNIIGTSPEVSTSSQVVYAKNNLNAQIYGVKPDYAELKEMNILFGKFFTVENNLQRDRVAVVDENIVAELFNNANPLGKDIRVGNLIVTVIGIVEGDNGQIYMPLSTVQLRIMGSKTYSQISVFVASEEDLEPVQEEIESRIMENHKITDPENMDFSVVNQAEAIETLNEITQIFTLLLGSIAAISLLVGGIGVMNIMLVSVTERTREIGIRKAIGAHRKDILFYFLIESVTLSILGGSIGLFLSFAIMYVLNTYLSMNVLLTFDSVAMAFMFSFFVGVVFGILPSYKASKLNPIEALRYE